MFELFGQQISLWECVGFASGIAGVLLTIKQNILCFPVGIINVAIYSFIFFNSGLYSNAMLQLIYIAVLAYGWIQWKNKGGAEEFPVTATGRTLSFMLVMTGTAAAVLLGYLEKTTDAPLPYWDAATTSMSLVAQWMIARKKIENWLLWIAADVIYVWMYLHQSLYLTAVLYFIFLILAVKGYTEWKRALSQKVSNA